LKKVRLIEHQQYVTADDNKLIDGRISWNQIHYRVHNGTRVGPIVFLLKPLNTFKI